MRTPARWVSAVVLAVALVLTVVSAILWPRSYYMRDAFGVRLAEQQVVGIISNRGSLSIAYVPENLDRRVVWFTRRPDDNLPVGPLGFGWLREGRRTAVSVPHWLVIPITAVVAFAAGSYTLSKLRPFGTCRKCGYDLRATPDRCPECGTSVDGAVA
jgi:hypothetical protein